MRIIQPGPESHIEAIECWRRGESASVVFADARSNEMEHVLGEYRGEPALITWTSGTTGKQKGVVIPWHAVEARCKSLKQALSPYDMSSVKSALPDNHSGGLITSRIFPHLAGSEIIPWEASGNPTCLIATPDILLKMVSGVLKGYDARALDDVRADLKLIISNGSLFKQDVRTQVSEAMGVQVLDLYGASEAGGICFDGRIMDGYEVRISDGTVHVRTDGLATAYLNHPYPIQIEDGWYNTNDAGHFEGDRLCIVRRKELPVSLARLVRKSDS